MSLHAHKTFACFVNAWKLIILWNKKIKGQKEKHTSSLLKRAWKLVRYIRCFPNMVYVCLSPVSSSRFWYLPPCRFHIWKVLSFPSPYTITYFLIVGLLIFFFHSIPRRLLGGLLFFDQSVICFAHILSYLQVYFLVHFLLFPFIFLKIEISIVRTDRKDYFTSSRPPHLSLFISIWSPFQPKSPTRTSQESLQSQQN